MALGQASSLHHVARGCHGSGTLFPRLVLVTLWDLCPIGKQLRVKHRLSRRPRPLRLGDKRWQCWAGRLGSRPRRVTSFANLSADAAAGDRARMFGMLSSSFEDDPFFSCVSGAGVRGRAGTRRSWAILRGKSVKTRERRRERIRVTPRDRLRKTRRAWKGREKRI